MSSTRRWALALVCLPLWGLGIGACKGAQKEKEEAAREEKAQEKNEEKATKMAANLVKLEKAIPDTEPAPKAPPKEIKGVTIEHLQFVERSHLRVVLAKKGADKPADHGTTYDLLMDRTSVGGEAGWLKGLKEELREADKRKFLKDFVLYRHIGVVVTDRLVEPVYADGAYKGGTFEGRVYLLDLEKGKNLGGALVSAKSPEQIEFSHGASDDAAEKEKTRAYVVNSHFSLAIREEAVVALGGKREPKKKE